MKKNIFVLGLFCMILLIGIVGSDWVDYLEVDLISYYKLDGTEGDVVDWTGNNVGTNEGLTRGATGKISDAFDGDGVDGYLDVSTMVTDVQSNTVGTISFWFKTHDVEDTSMVFTATDSGDVKSRFTVYQGTVPNGALCLGIHENEVGYDQCSSFIFAEEVWYHIVLVQDDVEAKFYVNNTLYSIGGTRTEWFNDVNDIDHVSIGSRLTSGGREHYLNGTVDEFGIWDRVLNSTEISDLYNSGDGVSPTSPPPQITVTLDSPENETVILVDNVNFTVNYTSTEINVTNVTFNVWFDNQTIFNQTTVDTNQAVANQTIELIGDFSLGSYWWNIEACGTNATGVFCWWADDNYTVSFAGEFSDFIFDTPILETSSQTFNVLLETPEGTTIQAGSGKLNYNGTDYSSITATDLGSNQFNLSKTIDISAGISGFSSENRSFFWNITVVDETSGDTFIQTSDPKNQNVTELKFGLCSSSLIIPMLNFTIYDENLGTEIDSGANAVTFQTTFEIGGSWSFMNKTVSVNNLSVDASEFDFCASDSTNIFYTDMEAFYEAVGFAGKNYYLTNATLTNTTNEINLYLLNESDAIEFFVSVEQDLIAVTSAQVNIQKYFVGEGVYKTVEIDETSSDTGEFTAYFDLDKDYKFIITKGGVVLGTVTKTASCKEAPCELTLSLTSAIYDIYSVYGEEFAGNVLYNLSYNPNAKIVTFDFIDTTGLANYFRMQTYEGKLNQSSTLIFDTTTYSSSGTITANLSTYDKGNFIVYTYVSRSPELFLDFLRITISDLVGTFGLLGLFLSFLLVITIIFGLSHSPPTLIISVPLALTIGQSIGILSLGWTAIILVWILAIISFWAVQR